MIIEDVQRDTQVLWFLDRAGTSLQTFRYYATRNVEFRQNHTVTLVGFLAHEIVAYGHLDPHADGLWLGVCVTEGMTGRGLGEQMVRELLRRAGTETVRLSVDALNEKAIKLYKKVGFETCSAETGTLFMKREAEKMADTLGSLVDKLVTVDMKMWTAQESLYEVRRMTFEEFKAKFSSDDGLRKIWEVFKKACDLNVQRSALVNEVDERVVAMIRAAVAGKNLDDGANIQRAHKTY